MSAEVRNIAFYLLQFHRIPENDEWWGEGFTEWTNVRKAKPLFKGHVQPIVPGELGYYDLLDEQIYADQAQMARNHGIEGFCYWHSWLGNGKSILEKSFNKVLETGKPDFLFCLCWANQSWTGVWHGAPGRVLIEHTYNGDEDMRLHFAFLAEAFRDPRYITFNGRPVFPIYGVRDLPDPPAYIPCITTGWDTTPRSKRRGVVFEGYSPELLGEYVRKAVLRNRQVGSDNFIFFKARNEWAEGNLLEPETRFRLKPLEAVAAALKG